MSSPPLVRALILSCHPIPSLAVTLISAGLGLLVHLSPERVVLVALAVLCGQLSIGWSNDYLDAERDFSVHRSDKPVAAGAVPRNIALAAAVVAIIAAIAFSAALGWPAGAVAMGTVLCGWLYNLGLKATAFSWLPFAVAFGLLPAVATLSRPQPRWPAWWALVAGALLGVAAHLANVLPDLRDDIATGIRGMGHRLGQEVTAIVTALTLFLGSVVILFGPSGQPGLWRWLAFAATTVLAVLATLTVRRNPSSAYYFRATIVIAALDLVSFALAGSAI